MISFISDLHLEYCGLNEKDILFQIKSNAKFLPLSCDKEVLIVAGDLIPFKFFPDIHPLCELLQEYYHHIIWIIGNKDLDNKAYSRKKVVNFKAIVEKKFNKFKILDNELLVLDEYIIGGALKPQQIKLCMQELHCSQSSSIVLVTHYPPSEIDLNNLSLLNLPIHWICGHLHTAIEYKSGNVSVYRNPFPIK